MSDSFSTVKMGNDDLVAILYTSGTTGKPKGAMLSQQNLLSNAKGLVNTWKFSKNDVLLHALPIYHTHGLFVAINVTLLSGGAIIFIPKFNSKYIDDSIPLKVGSKCGLKTYSVFFLLFLLNS